MPKQITRKCVCCGRQMKIQLNKDRKYSGGHYFGKVSLPIKGTGKNIITRTCRIRGKEFETFKWTGKETKVEYWECNKCYKE